MNRRAFLMILVGAVVLTASNAVVKLAGLDQLSLLEISFARFSLSAIVYLPFFVRERRSWNIFGNPLLILRGVIGFVAIILNYYAAMTIELGNATLLNLTSPIFTFLLAPILLHEHIPKRKFVWLLLAFCGVALITPLHLAPKAWGGYAAGLASGFCAASAYMTIRKLHERESFITISFSYSIIATALCLLAAPLGTFRPGVFVAHWDILLWVGVLGTFYQGLYTLALRFEKASRLAPLLYLSVLTSFVLGFFAFNETITAINSIGAVLVSVSLIILVG
jgi:drug/metabolite transporter (DMT)-like permease